MLPRSSQLDAKIAQESPTCGQDRRKYSSRISNQTPQDPKMLPERHSDAHFYMSAIFAKIGPKTFQNRQDGSPTGLKMAIWSPTWPILAPSWAIWLRFWTIQGRPKLSKIGQDSLQENLHAKIASKTSQNPSRPRFACFWDHF